MKKRIKIDSSLLSLVIIITGFLFYFPHLYPKSRFVDTLFNFMGFISIYKGVMLRMIARAHKKKLSYNSEELVTTGIYSLVRNPMYLGSFTIGVGFAFLLWPWWMVPVFVCLFYLRFRKEIVVEEGKLSKAFGQKYKAYCESVPQLFPRIGKTLKVKLRSICNLDEAMSTKEKRGLLMWPLLAIAMEALQQALVFGDIPLTGILATMAVSTGAYAAVFVFKYE